MEAVERAANISVGRACGFCGLAILCSMVGFAYDPHVSARVGGSFALIVSLVLAAKAALARKTPYKHTETWLLLADDERPSPLVAQAVISQVLQTVFLTYARYASVTAVGLLAASFVFGHEVL